MLYTLKEEDRHKEEAILSYERLINYLDERDFMTSIDSVWLKHNIKGFSDTRNSILEYLTEEQIKCLSSKVKNRLQAEANLAHKKANRWGLICMATGTGKSKTAIDAIKELITFNPDASILIVVPTAKLRDKTWKNEFIEWNAEVIWNTNVKKICYASASKLIQNEFDLVILDEVHNITERSSLLFEQNKIKCCIALTATPPQDKVKQILFEKCRLEVIYEITLDEAVDLGVVAPYEITIIQTELDKVRKNVKAGNKSKPFFTTEHNNYAYYAKIENSEDPIDQAKVGKFFYINRMRFIYDLNSKLEAAEHLLNLSKKFIPRELRVLIFCGSTKHADRLSTDVYHSKKKSDGYENFVTYKTNRLACVEALNEGDNLPEVDVAFVVQLNSKRLDLIQRMGRILRFRAGHVGRIIILCAKNTVDAKWVNRAISGLDENRIQWIDYKDLLEGKELLTF